MIVISFVNKYTKIDRRKIFLAKIVGTSHQVFSIFVIYFCHLHHWYYRQFPMSMFGRKRKTPCYSYRRRNGLTAISGNNCEIQVYETETTETKNCSLVCDIYHNQVVNIQHLWKRLQSLLNIRLSPPNGQILPTNSA